MAACRHHPDPLRTITLLNSCNDNLCNAISFLLVLNKNLPSFFSKITIPLAQSLSVVPSKEENVDLNAESSREEILP